MTCASTPRRHRFVTDEPDIPFAMPVIYEDAAIIVVDKPHFLATMPRGMWYRQTALMRLRERYGEPQITPAHRLDRATAGVLVFVRDSALRGAYQTLFQDRRAVKTYECAAPLKPVRHPSTGVVRALEPPRPFPLERRSRIVKTRGVLQAREVRGEPNAHTVIDRAQLLGYAHGAHGVGDGCGVRDVHRVHDARAVPIERYVLTPHTGKTHQLRVHMHALGLPIVGDDLYPTIEERAYDDFSRPLELVARRLAFDDPITGAHRVFVSSVPLLQR